MLQLMLDECLVIEMLDEMELEYELNACNLKLNIQKVQNER